MSQGPFPHPNHTPLVVHPSTADAAISGVWAHAFRMTRSLWVRFAVPDGPLLSLPPVVTPQTADNLWKTTCFEVFVRPQDGSAYREYNFSPSLEWAAYEFDAPREGMRPVKPPPPLQHQNHVIGAFPSLPNCYFLEMHLEVFPESHPAIEATWEVGLSAVIETKDGTKSFWALNHPSDKPDFHHPESFVLELPAPK